MHLPSLELTRGFLPSTDPLEKLPEPFRAWEEIASHLPKLLVSNQFKQRLEKLPVFPVQQLNTPAEHERAMLILSFLGHAYILGDSIPSTKVPAILAKPWCAIAEILKRPPVLSYASYALHNWRRINPGRPIELGNIVLLQNFLGGIDEEWFVLVHIEIEAKASTALQALFPAQVAAKKGDLENLAHFLSQIITALEGICDTLDRMPEHCDPYIYYNRVRPYIHGSKNNPAIPTGLIYENCFDNQAQFYRGETGAQSSIIPALDCFFGITHQKDELSVYLKEMRDYMPMDHRDFLEKLEKNGSIRAIVNQEHPQLPELRMLYNQSVDLIVRFRLTHFKYAALYIQKQSQSGAANSTTVGTGGTPFMNYLLKHEQEAELFKI
jgi:indoleamine 2,3-dioxygenase